MKYQVTFYKDEMQMLTERKANFVNKLKKLSSRVTQELANKIGGNGTTSEKIISFI